MMRAFAVHHTQGQTRLRAAGRFSPDRKPDGRRSLRGGVPSGAERLEAEHRPEAVRRRLSERRGQGYLGDAVLGGIDGCVTTFAVVAGLWAQASQGSWSWSWVSPTFWRTASAWR